MTTYPVTTTQTPETGLHVITWIVGILGMVTAAIGVWFATFEEGTISLFSEVYQRSDLATDWAPWLLILGGAIATLAFMTPAVRDFQRDRGAFMVGAETIFALVGVAAIVAGIVLLF